MEDNEARVIDEAIKFIRLIQYENWSDVLPPFDLEQAVLEYLKDNDETLDTY